MHFTERTINGECNFSLVRISRPVAGEWQTEKAGIKER